MTPIGRATAAVMESMGDGPGSRDYLRAQAIVRAVIAAIREPGLSALAAGADAIEAAPIDADDTHLAEVAWPAMIDKLLEEGR